MQPAAVFRYFNSAFFRAPRAIPPYVWGYALEGVSIHPTWHGARVCFCKPAPDDGRLFFNSHKPLRRAVAVPRPRFALVRPLLWRKPSTASQSRSHRIAG